MNASKPLVVNGVLVMVFSSGKIIELERAITQTVHGKKRIKIVKEHELTPHEDKDGYLRVRLSNNGKRIQFAVHQIVASAFLPNPQKHKSINHKDEDKKNNSSHNLEWCSVGYNNRYNSRYSRIRRNEKGVVQMTMSGDCVATYNSIKNAATSVNGKSSNIGNVCHGRMKSAYGFRWRFEGDNR